ncbi:MAG: ABC transporter substrate-binding protein [Actinomycetota bacterium]|nr:ABC transporter substrate-binding protein [Actinomycetota bacterium]
MAAACGGDDDKASEDDGPTTDKTELSGEPIKLMSITTVGTSGSDLPEIFSAGQAAVDAINADGGIDGRPLELIECNDQFDPNIAAQCGREAVQQGVVAVTGSAGNTADAYFPILQEAGIPLVGSAGQQNPELTSPNSYLITSGTIGEIYGAAKGLLDSGRTKLAIAYVDVAAGKFLAEGVAKAIEAQGGEPAIMVPIPFDATDLTAYAAQVVDKGADGVVSIISNQFPLMAQALHLTGEDIVLATPAVGLRPTDIDDLGDAAEGIQLASSFLPPSHPDLKPFQDELDEAGMDDARGTHALRAWAAVHIVADLLREAETPDAAGLIAAIKASGPIDFPGLAPFDWAKPVPGLDPLKLYSGQVNLQKIEDGEVVADSDEFVDFIDV